MNSVIKKAVYFAFTIIIFPSMASSEMRKSFAYSGSQKIEYFIDETPATFEISMDEKIEEVVYSGKPKLTDALFGTFASAAKSARFEVLPSFETSGSVAKAGNDKIYAEVELSLEDEKIELLKELAKNLKGEALTFICTALHLSGIKGTCPQTNEAEKFLKDTYNSKPIGFYAWSPKLETIFKRDRWLQKKFDTKKPEELKIAKELTEAVSGSIPLLKTKEVYKKIINTYRVLTNPAVNYFSALDDISSEKPFAFFPPSRSKEADLINKLVAKGGIAAGATMDILISAIKKGEVDLKPEASSGWYDHQQFATEPFLLPEKMPESKKLFFNNVYKKRLENSFRTSVTQARETHVKQLERPEAVEGVAPEVLEVELYISPKFSVEPMPEYYSRTAEGYKFLNDNLKIDPAVQGKISDLNKLFNELSLRSAEDIGLKAVAAPLPAADNFISNWKDMPEMGQDIRVIVPIGPLDGKDPSKGVNYWAVLGIEPLEIKVNYKDKPKIIIPQKNVKANIQYGTSRYTILVPVFAEVIIKDAAPPTREEFRKICDKYRTKDAILKYLRNFENPKDEQNPSGLNFLHDKPPNKAKEVA